MGVEGSPSHRRIIWQEILMNTEMNNESLFVNNHTIAFVVIHLDF